jgi:hypothetical protein
MELGLGMGGIVNDLNAEVSMLSPKDVDVYHSHTTQSTRLPLGLFHCPRRRTSTPHHALDPVLPCGLCSLYSFFRDI